MKIKLTLSILSVFFTVLLSSYTYSEVNQSYETIYTDSKINDNDQSELNNLKSEFNKGFEDGWCQGYKDVKGKNAYCPYAPYPPYPTYSQSSESYRDGYDTGFKAGRRKALNES